MDVFQFFTYLKQFNADVLLIGAGVFALDLLLGKTLLKGARAKLTAFLPFLLGGILYSAYTAATDGFAEGVTVSDAISAGITCGSLATVINVACGRLGKPADGGKTRAECVKALLAGWDITDEQARSLADAVGREGDEGKELLAQITGEETAKTVYPFLEKALSAL